MNEKRHKKERAYNKRLTGSNWNGINNKEQ